MRNERISGREKKRRKEDEMEMNPRCEVCGTPMVVTCSGDWRCPINDLHWLIEEDEMSNKEELVKEMVGEGSEERNKERRTKWLKKG